jgi:DNA-binding beta-propeller fold protein YncE
LVVFVADSYANTIRRVDVETGIVSTIAGRADVAGSQDGIGAAATFDLPSGIAVSHDGTFALIADKNNNKIRKLMLATGEVTSLAGSNAIYCSLQYTVGCVDTAGSTDGVGGAASFNFPFSVDISPDDTC